MSGRAGAKKRRQNRFWIGLGYRFAPRNCWSCHAVQKDVSQGNREGKGNAGGRMGDPLKRFVSAAGSESVSQTSQPICAIVQTHCSGYGLAAHPAESRFL